MNEDRNRWNERYREDDYLLGTKPSPFLRAQMETLLRLCPGRRALDLACGEGRNSVYLALHGFLVTGIDISDRGLAKAEALMRSAGVKVDFIQGDLEEYLPQGQFDLIINFNFLLRELVHPMVERLSPGGIILFDTILNAPGAPSSHRKEHLLQPGELVALFADCGGEILVSEELLSETPTARLFFRKDPENKG